MKPLLAVLFLTVVTTYSVKTQAQGIEHDCFLWQANIGGSSAYTLNFCSITVNDVPTVTGVTHTYMDTLFAVDSFLDGVPFGSPSSLKSDLQVYPGPLGSNGFPEVFLETSILALIAFTSDILYSPFEATSVAGGVLTGGTKDQQSAVFATGVFQGPP